MREELLKAFLGGKMDYGMPGGPFDFEERLAENLGLRGMFGSRSSRRPDAEAVLEMLKKMGTIVKVDKSAHHLISDAALVGKEAETKHLGIFIEQLVAAREKQAEETEATQKQLRETVEELEESLSRLEERAHNAEHQLRHVTRDHNRSDRMICNIKELLAGADGDHEETVLRLKALLDIPVPAKTPEEAPTASTEELPPSETEEAAAA